MEQINAVITGVGGYVPDYILTNDEISKMVDTTDEWIVCRNCLSGWFGSGWRQV